MSSSFPSPFALPEHDRLFPERAYAPGYEPPPRLGIAQPEPEAITSLGEIARFLVSLGLVVLCLGGISVLLMGG